MKTATLFIALACAILSACGGGGGGASATPKVNPKAVYPVPVLRPCETTGPTAPACPASSTAIAH